MTAAHAPAAELVSAGLASDGRVRLHPTDLALRAGAVTAVVGRNGSGKSTLLGLLAGELVPTSGRAIVDGDPVTDLDHRGLARRRALLSQDEQVSFGFTVQEVVSWGRTAWAGEPQASEDAMAVESALVECHLVSIRDRAVPSLSGGERKRVHLARVLAQDAPLLLLDEADSDLDLVGRRIIDELVMRRARAGGTAVIVSHDLARMGHVCDDVVLLAEGRVLAAGPREQVLTEPLLTRAFGVPVRVHGRGDDLTVRIAGEGPA